MLNSLFLTSRDMGMTDATLFYVHDPMCSWCWAYRPALLQIQDALRGKVDIIDIVGGLAPDTDEPMPQDMQQTIEGYWRKIAAQLGTEFNYDFWKKNTPKRATYPACRAVLAAEKQGGQDTARAMTLAIQQAYYLRAMNPSEEDTLLQLADEMGLNFDIFMADLDSDAIQTELLEAIAFARSIGGNNFPSWFLKQGDVYTHIPVDYESAHTTLALISEARQR